VSPCLHHLDPLVPRAAKLTVHDLGQRAANLELGALHSSTFQLNLSALYEIGGARRGCVARVKGVLGSV
jgi:hypothetical protein